MRASAENLAAEVAAGAAPMKTVKYVFAQLREDEYDLVRARARRANLTISNYLRHCINAVLREEGDDTPPLAQRRQRPRQSSR